MLASQITDAERDALLTRVLQAAAAVVTENDLEDEFGNCVAPVGVRELADALDELPLAERLRWGL